MARIPIIIDINNQCGKVEESVWTQNTKMNVACIALEDNVNVGRQREKDKREGQTSKLKAGKRGRVWGRNCK